MTAGPSRAALGEGLGLMKVRRVVTGQEPGGKSVFVSDSEVDPIELSIMPGTAFHRIWGLRRAADASD